MAVIGDVSLHVTSENVKRQPPINLTKDDIPFFEREYSRIISSPKIYNFKNVNITNQGIIFKKFNVINDSIPHFAKKDDYNSIFCLKTYLKSKKIKTKSDFSYILAYDMWATGYFHWITDVLPRLYVVKEHLANLIILLPISLQNYEFATKSLNLFKYKDLFFIPKNSYVKCDNCLYITPTAPTGNYNETVITGLRNYILSILEPAKLSSYGDKLYISRSKSTRRRIENESEVQDLLHSEGFTTIYCEDLTFDQQVGAAFYAKCIVSPHGAGLTNILFMNPGGYVLELKKKNDEYNHCYFSLASAVKLKYLYQFCMSENHQSFHSDDLIVDIKKLQENLNLIEY